MATASRRPPALDAPGRLNTNLRSFDVDDADDEMVARLIDGGGDDAEGDPNRAFTFEDQARLRKENFDLKLQLYNLKQKWDSLPDDVRLAVDENATLKTTLAQRTAELQERSAQLQRALETIEFLRSLQERRDQEDRARAARQAADQRDAFGALPTELSWNDLQDTSTIPPELLRGDPNQASASTSSLPPLSPLLPSRQRVATARESSSSTAAASSTVPPPVPTTATNGSAPPPAHRDDGRERDRRRRRINQDRHREPSPTSSTPTSSASSNSAPSDDDAEDRGKHRDRHHDGDRRRTDKNTFKDRDPRVTNGVDKHHRHDDDRHSKRSARADEAGDSGARRRSAGGSRSPLPRLRDGDDSGNRVPQRSPERRRALEGDREYDSAFDDSARRYYRSSTRYDDYDRLPLRRDRDPLYTDVSTDRLRYTTPSRFRTDDFPPAGAYRSPAYDTRSSPSVIATRTRTLPPAGLTSDSLLDRVVRLEVQSAELRGQLKHQLLERGLTGL